MEDKKRKGIQPIEENDESEPVRKLLKSTPAPSQLDSSDAADSFLHTSVFGPSRIPTTERVYFHSPAALVDSHNVNKLT